MMVREYDPVREHPENSPMKPPMFGWKRLFHGWDINRATLVAKNRVRLSRLKRMVRKTEFPFNDIPAGGKGSIDFYDYMGYDFRVLS